MQDMYHQSHGCGDIFSSRGTFSQERHLFLHGGNTHADSGLVLSTDAKPRLKWTPELHQRFIEAVNQLGGAEKATPKTVMRLMGIPGLTLYHLKSHLQKYRLSKNLQAQGSNGTTKSAISCVIPADKAPLTNVPINNSNVPPQTERTIQLGEALQMQIEVQRQLNEQLEVQRHLQLRIEAQGKYLQAVLEKAQETLGKQNTAPTCQEDAKTSISDMVTQASTECFDNRFQDCSIGNSLATSEEFRKINYNSNSNLKFEDTSAPPQYYNPSRKEKNRDVNSNFGLANIGAKLDLNSHEENENTDSSCRRFDLNGLSWN